MMRTIVPSPMYMTGFLQRIHVDRATSHWSQPPTSSFCTMCTIANGARPPPGASNRYDAGEYPFGFFWSRRHVPASEALKCGLARS